MAVDPSSLRPATGAHPGATRGSTGAGVASCLPDGLPAAR